MCQTKIALCVGKGKNYGPDWVGVDIIDHGFRPLILQDVRTMDGYRLARAECIFATPPCTEFSFARIPYRPFPPPDLSIVEACIRIGHEAGVPFILENVAGLQQLIGPATAHRGPWYFWGDVGLLPLGKFSKRTKEVRNPLDRASVPKELIP